MLYLIYFILLHVTLLILSYFVSVFIHELGHAIPTLVFGKKDVNVYIGSFGETKNSVRIPIGRLIIHLEKNPFKWTKGLCSSSEQFSINKNLIIFFAGPVASILVFVTAYAIFVSYEKFDAGDFFLLIVLGTSGFAVLSSLIPRKLGEISVKTGLPLYSDGYWIVHFIKLKGQPETYFQATTLISKKQYKEAEDLLATVDDGKQKKNFYELLLYANLQARNYAKAEEVSNHIFEKFKHTANDYYYRAYILIIQKQLDKALGYFQKSLQIDPKSAQAMNGIGYCLSHLHQCEKAIQYFDSAILLFPKFSHAYSNRGFAKIKLKMLDEALMDIEHSLSLDSNEGETYKNLGLYHLEKNNFDEAQSLFFKAKELDADIYMIDEYIDELKQRRG